MPLISVCVLAYNTGAYLLPCLRSVAAQTHTNLDVIVVDNGSTDGTAKLCEDFAAQDTRFCVIHQQNLGSSGGRATAIAAARGEYIAFVDGDDVLHPQMLACLLAACQASAMPIAACRILPFWGDVPPLGAAPAQPQIWGAPQHLDALLHHAGVAYSLCNKLYQTALMQAQVWDNTIAHNEDLLANWQVLQGVQGMAFADFDGYFYRQHPQSASHKRLEAKSISDQLSVAEAIRAAAQSTPLATSANAFYYEKILYLDSMILRQTHAHQLAAQHAQCKALARKNLGAALRNPQLSTGMKCVALLTCFGGIFYKALCRFVLTDRR